MLRRLARRLIHGRPQPPQWQRLEAEGIVSAGVGTYGMDLMHIHEFRVPDGTWVGARLRIGKYTSIAPCDVFLSGNHHSEWVSQYPFRSVFDLPGRDTDSYTNGDVEIGHDVWLAHGCHIMSGVTIGHGAVVASKAVVTNDVEPYTIVGGVPAKVIRPRFDAATVDRLLSLAWWDWPEDRIRAELPTLLAPPT